MRQIPGNTYKNTRTRFQRLSDAKIFSGWVRSFARNSIVITSTRVVDLKNGDEFMFQLFGHGSSLMFQATLNMQAGDEYAFTVSSPTRTVKTKENIRLQVEGMSGVLVHNGEKLDVHMLDISPNGAGIISSRSFERGQKVELRIDSPQGQIVCVGEVKYCRWDDRFMGQYRTGMSLVPHNRVDVARWQRMIMSDAA